MSQRIIDKNGQEYEIVEESLNAPYVMKEGDAILAIRKVEKPTFPPAYYHCKCGKRLGVCCVECDDCAKPAPKANVVSTSERRESERLWAIYFEAMHRFWTTCNTENGHRTLNRMLADAIKAEILEQLEAKHERR